MAVIVGWTVLGAALDVTARFDDDADWNVSPGLALLGMLAGLFGGVFASVVSFCSGRLGFRTAWILTGLWTGFVALTIGLFVLASVAAPGVGFLVAGVHVVLGSVVLVAIGVATTRPSAEAG